MDLVPLTGGAAPERKERKTQAVRFLDGLSVGRATGNLTGNLLTPAEAGLAAAAGVRPSAVLAAEMAAARGGGTCSTSGFLDAKGTRVAQAYGVEKLIKNEELHARHQGHKPGGVPTSGGRRTSELEMKLRDALRERAASKLQVEQLRAENRRKGSRIDQLEKLIALLEEHNRSLGTPPPPPARTRANARTPHHAK
jgi:hypothetical protein